MDKRMVITSTQATAIYNAVMAKAREDDSIEIDTHYRTSEYTGESYFVTSFDAFGKGMSLKSYIAITVRFYNDHISVDISRNKKHSKKHGNYRFDIC